MRIEQFIPNIQKRGIPHRAGEPADRASLAEAEHRLGQPLPAQLRLFYEHLNGLEIHEPPLIILPIEQLERGPHGCVHFATVDRQHRLVLDLRGLNAAGQWSVVAEESEHLVTLTLASFWSNKVFAWLDARREIWSREHAA